MEEPPHCRLYNWFIQSNLLQDLYKQVDETLAVQRLIIPVDTSALLEFDSHLGNCLVGNYDRFCKITKEVCSFWNSTIIKFWNLITYKIVLNWSKQINLLGLFWSVGVLRVSDCLHESAVLYCETLTSSSNESHHSGRGLSFGMSLFF